MLSSILKVFFSVFDTFSHIVVKSWFVWHEIRRTTLFGIYYFVCFAWNWVHNTIFLCYCVGIVRIENNNYIFENTSQDPFKCFFNVFRTISHKIVQCWIVWHEPRHTALFSIYYCVEIVRIEKNSHMLEIMCYVPYKGFSAFLTLSRIK